MILEDRVLLHLQGGKRIPIDPQEIYLLEAKSCPSAVVRLQSSESASLSSRDVDVGQSILSRV